MVKFSVKLATVCLSCFAALSSVCAQQATLEEIVVTAQRRAENIQKVPIVINAVTAELATQRGVTSVLDLGTIAPGFQYNRSTNNSLVFLRGVGAGSGAAGQEGSVSFYLDDVYVYSMNAMVFELNNIERVEVSSGPQGTLFGRNALGGVVQVVTKEPQHQPELNTHLGYGNYGTFRGDLYGTGGITDNLAGDISVLYLNQEDGFGRNVITNDPVFNLEETSLRTKWLWTPGSKTDVTFTLMHDKTSDNVGVADRLLPGSLGRDGVSRGPTSGFYDVNQDLFSRWHNTAWASSLTVKHDFDSVQIKNIAAYQDNETLNTHDADFSPTFLSHQDPVALFSNTWTNEFQVLSGPDSKIDWIAGAFYLNNRSGYSPARVLSNPPTATNGQYFDIFVTLDTESYAAFAQATAEVLPNTRLTGGVRYTEDQRHVWGFNQGQNGAVTGAGDQETTFGKPTYKAALDHDLSESVLAYVSYSRGFKAGTYNTTAPADPAIRPEVIDAYEAGIKAELLDRTLRLNLAGFYYDYKDLQLRQVTAASITRLLNAAETRHYGVDLSIDALVTEHFTVQGAFEWLDAQFTKFPGAPATQRNPLGGNTTVIMDFTGRSVFQAPEISASLGAQYAMPTRLGELVWAANYQYNDGFSWTVEVDDRTRQRAFSLLNLSVTWKPTSGNWDLRLWGKNVTDAEYNTFVNTSAFGDYGSPASPMTYGITFGLYL